MSSITSLEINYPHGHSPGDRLPTTMAKSRVRGIVAESSSPTLPAARAVDVEWVSVAPPGARHVPLSSKRTAPTRNLLTVRTLYRDLIHEVPDFLSKAETEAWIHFGETHGFDRCFHRASREVAHRDNGRIELVNPEIAAALFQRLRLLIPATVHQRKAHSAHSKIRLYRYQAGQRFGKHIDESTRDEATGAWSEITVLIYLNGGPSEDLYELRGGETIFYQGNHHSDKNPVVLQVSPRRGCALLHGHGRRCLLHEGAEVERGVKVRTGLNSTSREAESN